MKSESASNGPFAVAHHWIGQHVSRDTRRRTTAARSHARESHRTLCLTWRFAASPERIFNAWLDPPFAARWLFATASRPIAHVEIDARVGGAFRFVDRHYDKSTEY